MFLIGAGFKVYLLADDLPFVLTDGILCNPLACVLREDLALKGYERSYVFVYQFKRRSSSID